MSEKLKYDVQYNDPVTGKQKKINRGTILYTEQDQKMKELKKEAKHRRFLRRDNEKRLGGFVSMRSVPLKKKINPQTLGRLAYLSVYLGYDTDRLMLSERQPMYRQDLPDVLRLPASTTNDFIHDATASGILVVDECGQLFMDETFFKGRTKRKKKIHLFIDSIKSLYNRMMGENRIEGKRKGKNQNVRYFGYIIALIPFINKEWNVVCHNPEERDIHKLDCMSIGEICQLLKVNAGASNRIVNVLTHISFVVNGEDGKPQQEQALCNFIKDIVTNKYRLIINPDLLFMGSNPEQVKSYGQFFPVKPLKGF